MKILAIILALLCAVALLSVAVVLAVLVLIALGVEDVDDDFNPNDYNPF